jgi:hypothetical protein
MSGYESYPPPGGGTPPPPGWEPPTTHQPPPPYAAPPPGWPPAPGMLGAAHKPGAIPLRPLALGDLYDGAFRVIRYNPKVTVGAPVLVAALALLLPVLLSIGLTWGAGFALDLDDESVDLGTGDVLALVAIIGSFVLGGIAQGVGSLLVTGMIAHVVLAAAVGRRLGLGEAWAATHGKRWRIIGLAVVIGIAWALAAGVYAGLWVLLALTVDSTAALVIFGVVSVPVAIALAAFAYVRLVHVAIPALVLEDGVGVFGAFGRAARLTKGSFWRVLGIFLLTFLIAQVGSAVLTCPLGLLAGVASFAVPPEYELLTSLLVNAVSSVLSAALVTPFLTSVSTLQYVDLRMRREAFDVELMTRAGITAS